jgi:colanic acid biosynthesis glycosyl transferase WcaI
MELAGKHITFISLNYAPEDTAIGLYSTQMVAALIAAGAIVNVVTAFPYYPQWEIATDYKQKPNYLIEKLQNVNVYRYKQYVPSTPSFVKRIVHILSFTKGSYFNLRKINQADLVISIVPFTASARLGKSYASKHDIPHWIHIQDFEFDAAQQSGVSGGGKKLLFKQLFRIEKRIYDSASKVSTISNLMMAKLRAKAATPSYYLPNWIDPLQIDPQRAQPHEALASKQFKLLYSGNVGDKQDWDFFLAFAKALPPQNYHITIVGAGSRFTWLQEQINQPNVEFHQPVPYDQLCDLLCSADAHFLFQKEQVIDTVMPSKLLGMMASARPSLVLGNAGSEVRTVLENAHGGAYLSNYQVNDAISIMEKWRLEDALRQKLGNNARAYVLEHFSRDAILSRWITSLNQLLA